VIEYLINVKSLCVAYFLRSDEVMIVRYVQPLTDEQRALLEKTMKEDTVFRARSRAHSLLLSAAGTPIKAIAEAYQVHRVTVSAWIKKWEHHDDPHGRLRWVLASHSMTGKHPSSS
jgi:hypothetical protein